MPKMEEMSRDVKMPSGVTTTYEKGILTIKGPRGVLERSFVHPRVQLKVSKDTVSTYCNRPNRREMGLTGTWWAHVKNMVEGVTDGFHYKMRIIYSHFPIKTSLKGTELVIENFLGERFPRKANVLEGVTTKISGDTITLEGNNKENVGQTAANIEKATKVKNYDPRVFQDGIYLVKRGE
ncbi:MAG: 50S ribosomal protein L6 [Thermoplasmata archaeon]|nr:50S ribosomal protein L6 [Thermoplasmata archaeon]